MKLTEEQKEQILSLHIEGKSSRYIAKKILGRETKKSTVGDYLRTKNFTPPENKNLKILVLDIETSPCVSYHWKRWKENIGQEQAISESFILTYAAKWLHNSNIIIGNLEEDEVRAENDKRLVKELHEILELADIVVAHNGQRFDIPVINTRILCHRLPPPCPYKIVDTLKVAKALFRFPSNSLDSLAAYLGIGRKTATGGFILWKEYMQGDQDAIDKMVNYNIDDVELLQEVYMAMRAWDRRHPNVAIEHGGCCPCCGSDNVAKLDQYVYTTASKFHVYTCRQCHKKFRSKTRIKASSEFVNIV